MNTKYNGFEFLKKNIKIEPELRFKGSSIEEYKKFSVDAKAKLREILGISKFKSCPLNSKLIEEINCEGYKRIKYEIDTTENLSMPFYVLIPENNSNGKAVIAIHGHGSEGKEGLVGKEAEANRHNITRFNYTYAYELLNLGYTVFVPDIIGSGERTLGIYGDGKAECNDINNSLISLGMCMQGLILYENMRLIDFIKEQGFEEINCCGFSGGGHSSLWLAVMDDRINKAIVSGFFHSFDDSLIYQNRCGCNFIPNQWLYVDMCDILALAAPKEILLETGKDDKLNGVRGLEGVYEQLEIANKCYRLFGKELSINVCDGAHKWFGSCINGF